MAFINVAEWTPENVAQWLQGLEDCILPYVNFFLNNQINGCRLLLLNSEDLTKLNVTKIGHQEIILDGVDLLKHLHYNFNSETLQSLALRLACKSRSLYNQLTLEKNEVAKLNLKQNNGSTNNSKSSSKSSQNAISKLSSKESKNSKNNSNNSSQKNLAKNLLESNLTNTSNKVSTKTLFAVCDILNAAKTFVSWIDRYPFEGQDVYKPIRKTILKLSIELASTSQRDQFVDHPNEIILTNCLTFAGLCERIVQDLHDSLAIQPASLDVALIKKRPDEELGMHIHSSYSGIHIISGIKLSSATNNCGRIDEGDEIVQVNYRTVVGWQLRKLVDIVKEYQTELVLTLKKRPKHSVSNGQMNVAKPFKLPLKEYSANQNNNTINKEILSGSMTLRHKPRKMLPNEEFDSEYCNLIGLSQMKIDSQNSTASLSKSKTTLRRRATISGSSNSVNSCGIVRVDDLLIKNHQNSAKIQNEVKQQKLAQENQSSNSNLPYAKVQPLNSMNDESSQQNKQASTFCITNSSNGKAIAVIKSQSENVGIVLPNINRSNNSKSPQSLKLSTFQPENNKQESLNASTENISSNKPPPPPSRKNNSVAISEKPAVPMRPASINNNFNSNNSSISNSSLTVNLNRFVTLKQIEEENSKFFDQNPESTLCQLINKNNSSTNNNTIDKTSSLNKECNNLLSGWLYTKRENFNTLLNAKAKWTAKYVQLSTNYLLYAFKNEHATKADLVINLAAFKVSPACECKSKDHVFKTFNKHAIFLFSCESQFQMRHWVDTLRHLVSNCASTKPELMKISLNPEVACYSETEDEEDVIDDEMMLQNFANELVETNEREQQEKETIKAEIDVIKTEVDVNVQKKSIDEQLTPQKKLESKNSVSYENKSNTNEEEDEEDEKHNRRMTRLLNRRRQRYTSTADSYRDSSPSSTSSASSSANNSFGQAVLSRFAANSELREKLQKQAQEKLEQRKLALASGNKMYNRSVSCMESSSINNLRERLNSTLTKNNLNKENLTRNKFSGSQQSLISPTFKEANNQANKSEKLPVKPFFMTNKNKVLPPIPHLPPRPPKPSSISMNNSINETINTIDQTNIYTELNDELKKSQPLPQPRNSKNGQSAAVEDERQLADEIVNKENINSSNKISDPSTNNDNFLKKALCSKLDEQKSFIGNHKDNEYISSIIDELYNFAEETKPEPVISKPIIQSEPESVLSCAAPIPSTSTCLITESFDKKNFNQNNSNVSNNPSLMNFDQNFNFNQLNEQSINSQNVIPHQLQSMLMTGNRQVQMLDDDLDYLDDEECLDDEEEDEEYSDEEDEEDESEFNNVLNNDFNKLPSQTANNNFNSKPDQSNIFSLGSELNSLQPSVSNNYSATNGNVDFLAPGPNFLNSAPGLTNNQKTISVNNNQDFHLGSSSNSNNYPSSSSANSFNISPYSSISQHQQSNCSPTQPLENGFNSQNSNVFSKIGNSADEQLSDSSSGVSSYVSAMAEIQSAEYLKVLQIIHQQQLANLPPEAQQQFAQQFQEQFQQHFQYQLQLQLQQQLLAQQQGQQTSQQQLFNPQQGGLDNQQNVNNQVNGVFNQLQDGINNQSNQQEELFRQIMAGRMGMEDLEDDLSETDSDLSCGSLDEEDEEDDLEDFECQEGGNKKPDKKTGRKSSFRLFGSPKLLKKLTTLKHQKEKRSIGNSMVRNSSLMDNRDDTTSVWISMGDKMLDDESDFVVVDKNDSDGKALMENKLDVGDQTKTKDESPSTDEGLESSKKQTSDSKIIVNDKNKDKNIFEKNSKIMTSKVEDCTSLNSSQSSFVQISTNDTTSTLTKEKSLQKSSSSLSNKWFGKIKNSSRIPETKISEKQMPVKNAPQITQVIYKRRPALPQPKIPEKPTERIKSVESTLITVPDDDDKEAEEDTIYAEINETQLVLEEMRRSLDRHSTERKIIEMILHQPSSVPDNKVNRIIDQLKVK